MRLDCAQAFRASCEKLTLARREVFFRLAEPPDKMDFHFISPCGAKLYEVTEVKMEQNELQRTLMAILFAAGEPVAASRLSETLAVDEAQIHEELDVSHERAGVPPQRYPHCAAGGRVSDVLGGRAGGVCDPDARDEKAAEAVKFAARDAQRHRLLPACDEGLCRADSGR